jgi:glutamyl-tRNA reductase
VIANRTAATARALADELGAEAATLDRLDLLVAEADLVVGALAGGGAILRAADLSAALGRRSNSSGPMHLLDLGHPRNFAADVCSVDGVVVQDLDAVFERVTAAGAERQKHVPLVEAIIREEIGSYLAWLKSRPNVAVLRAVRERAMDLARAEADRFARGSEAEERERLRALASAVARTLLHSPTVALRDADPSSLEGQWLVESAATLFATRGRRGNPERALATQRTESE